VTLRNPVTSVLDIAPDGEFFAFNGSDGIYVRAMGESQPRVIPGTGGAIADVVVSPDGREVAFYRNGPPQIAKIAVAGGAPVVLVDPANAPYGIDWEPNGTIFFGQPDGIWRVSDNGGTPQRVVEIEGNARAYGPQLLPGGEWLLFTLSPAISPNRWNEADIVIQSLTTGERRVLRSGGHDARYLPTGHITYMFDNVLFASAFDPESLTLDDERVSLIQGVQTAVPVVGGSGFYAVSRNGTLVYVPGTAGAGALRPSKNLAWVDPQGRMELLPIRADDYTMARLSPDGTKVAVVVGSALPQTDPAPDIYVYDLETENLTQLTFDPAVDDGPVWSRDGSRIFFRSYRGENGIGAVYSIPAEGGTPELLARSTTGQNPLPWSASADGRTLLLVDAISLQDVNFATLDIDNDDELKPLLDENGIVTEPSLSPDGQWLVYYGAERENDAVEINLRPFPNVRQQRRPVGMGRHPVFSADGSKIFFFDGGGLSMAPVQYGPLRVGQPTMLFRGAYWYGVANAQGDLGRAWDADPKNDRFLMITMPDVGGADASGAARQRVNVVLDWFSELRQRVPQPDR
jgi:Tol biopolymer transport system component